ncbi:MAG: YhbY family RNA-binding protein [Oscillospiraceae bacterium]|nr:YhbY family RNA-binding protein [Oscillospiraceae bacterium]
MLTSKQRAFLRSLAAAADTILIVGKGGVTPNTVTEAENALRARELVKGRVLENSLLTPREAAETIAERCRAEVVQCIGSKFVLYKRNETSPKIELPSRRKKK